MAKKKEIEIDKLDFDSLLQETIASCRLGRALASLGATLTGREKRDAKLVYILLKAQREYSKKLPVMATISRTSETKEYGSVEAIRWFAHKYPKRAEPLLRRMHESYTKPTVVLNYGLKEKGDLPDSYYVKTLTRVLNISEDKARVLYHGIIKSGLEREKKESRLVSTAMKEK